MMGWLCEEVVVEGVLLHGEDVDRVRLGDVALLKHFGVHPETRVANDHDRDQIFWLDYPIPTDSNWL